MANAVKYPNQPTTRARYETRRGSRLVAAYLLVDGIAILGIWSVSLMRGAFGGMHGLFQYQEGNYPIFHVLAETLMGCTSVAAGVRLWRTERSGRDLALVANGLLVYSAINNSGWPLYNDPTLLLPMGFTLVGSLAAIAYLLHRAPRP